MQAAQKSGTEITANLALEEGREVFAVPNSPLNKAFKGCNTLIKDGAKIITCAEDILESLPNWSNLT